MSKKKVDPDYAGIPRGLGARKAVQAARDAEAAVAENDKAKVYVFALHRALEAEARRVAGIKARGLTDTGKDRTKGK